MIMGKLNVSSSFLQTLTSNDRSFESEDFRKLVVLVANWLDVFNRSFKLSTKLSLKTPIQFKDGAQCS